MTEENNLNSRAFNFVLGAADASRLASHTLTAERKARLLAEASAEQAGDVQSATALFRVVATRLDTGERCLIAEGKTKRNADAIEAMAVIRRGVDEESFSVEPETTQFSALSRMGG